MTKTSAPISAQTSLSFAAIGMFALLSGCAVQPSSDTRAVNLGNNAADPSQPPASSAPAPTLTEKPLPPVP